MNSAFITGAVVGLVIGSILGGLVLWGLARGLGKIANASYGNSFLVCLISGTIDLAVMYMIGSDWILAGIGTAMAAYVVLLSVTYISVGKFVWKCSWLQSFKANIVWIVLFAGLLAFGMSQMPSMPTP